MGKKNRDDCPFDFYFIAWDGRGSSFPFGWLCECSRNEELRTRVVDFTKEKTGRRYSALVVSSKEINVGASAKWLGEFHMDTELTWLDWAKLHIKRLL